jgi:hypothetical protein
LHEEFLVLTKGVVCQSKREEYVALFKIMWCPFIKELKDNSLTVKSGKKYNNERRFEKRLGC